MNGVSLPRDHEERANFDQQDAFILGNPATSFDRSCGHDYDRKSDNPHAGYPVWKNKFLYILRDCGYLEDYDTVYVMVDTRNLADHTLRDPVFHNVHPTWAGTFVLAALGASFPGKHFFLLDSDCLPVAI